MKNWKRRYFKLVKESINEKEKEKGASLYYYKGKATESSKFAGCIKLKGSESKLYDTPRNETVIMITPSVQADPKQKIFLLKADPTATNEPVENMREWAAAIAECSKI